VTAKRKPISKKTRFEVFKRDSFTCQYCGKKAPEVVLHVDHVHPVSKGGTSDILNLVTSCDGCNLGKSNGSLDDSSVVRKKMNQAKILQEKLEQIEMIADWQRGLADIDQVALSQASEYYSRLVPGWHLNATGQSALRKYIQKYGLADVMSAMRTAAAAHVRIDANGKATEESAAIACRVYSNSLKYKEANERDPVAAGALYAAGIARNRLPYLPANHRLVFVEWARSGVSAQELRDAAQLFNSWSALCQGIEDRIEAL
jgi:hypothetical protein